MIQQEPTKKGKKKKILNDCKNRQTYIGSL
jgi:hypothetical protein